jgi:uncharacterized iron-regulated protein
MQSQAPFRLSCCFAGPLGRTLVLLGYAASLACHDGRAPAAPHHPEADPRPSGLVASRVSQAAPLRAVLGSGALSELELVNLLSEQPVVCLGESHDRTQDHLIQARLVVALAARAAASLRPIAVGLEMLPSALQPKLDDYLAGKLSLEALPAAVQWAEHWGFPFSLYVPVLEAARSAGVPLLALNVPRQLTRSIAKQGLSRATAGAAALKLPELKLDDSEHRAFFLRAMSGMGHAVSPQGLENYYAAQVTWDESMAEHASNWLTASQTSDATFPQIIILAGAGHCHRSAIPRRITRRTGLRAYACELNHSKDQTVLSGSAFDVLIWVD